MKEWILILKLLGQDHITDEFEWHEAIRLENITFQTCIEALVDTVNIMQDANLKHEVYCTTKAREATKAK